jgi:hypothetical protein
MAQIVPELAQTGNTVFVNQIPTMNPNGTSARRATIRSIQAMNDEMADLVNGGSVRLGDQTVFEYTSNHPDLLFDGVHPDPDAQRALGFALAKVIYEALFDTPTALAATIDTSGPDPVISWPASPSASSYNLLWTPDGNGPYTVVASELTDTTYTDTDSPGSGYYVPVGVP